MCEESAVRSRIIALALVGLIANTGSFGLLSFPAVAASPSGNANLKLGVVRSSENQQTWEAIATRLQAAQLNYQIVELVALEEAATSDAFNVLFLPNIATFTPAQIQALEAWIERGGRLITSGPVGDLSSVWVRSRLRSLLGAYWAFPLSTPASLAPVQCTGQCPPVPQNLTQQSLWGGAVIPVGLDSRAIATWQAADTPPAIVVTPRATLFGWYWGQENSGGSPELESAWLRTAVLNYGNLPPVTAPTASTPSGSRIYRQPSTTVPGVARPPVPSARQGMLRSPQTAPPMIRANQDKPILAAPTPSVSQSPNADKVSEPVTPPERLSRVSPSDLPITPVEAIALRQDVEQLIGRVESTSLAVSAVNGTATRPSAIAQARTALERFQALVEQQNYAEARQQLIDTREQLITAYPARRLPETAEIRAMWLDRGTIVQAGSERGLAQIFDRLAAAGINTVFFETVNAGYPIYPSNIAPQANPLVNGWDPLASAVKLAHERGIELHAWVWAFAVGNERHNVLANLPRNYPGPILSAHPDWASYDNRGNLIPRGQDKPFLDPANPEARRYLLSLIDEIVTQYRVDGVQLDYIRYPFQDPSAERSYGYGKAAREQFRALAGVDPRQISPRQTELWQRWTDFRVQQVNSFVADVSQLLRRRRSDLTLSVAVFPLSEHERIHKLQQHWETWARRGDVDLVVPMTYATESDRFGRLTLPLITNESLGSALVVPGIRLLDLPKAIAVDRIQLLRDRPALGYALFAAENLTRELETFLNSTQGATSQRTPSAIPHRQPFQAASTRYAALQQEWSFLSNQNQLRMREPALQAFDRRSQTLASALKQLAQQPSPRNLQAARQELQAFRQEFPNWMSIQRLEQAYQVSTWENRLASIELLLNYGEQRNATR
ncbi:MAG: family 10 glycosylhydrolase [Desertifilum sp. SIO1I2]|nr:family 10 glycosylhydrolase [Desertifilum sp. SIO1I2]